MSTNFPANSKVICILIILLISNLISAQEKPVSLPNTQTFSIHSDAVNDDYEIYISLPLGYGTGDTKYKTLYVLDANVTFGMTHDIQTLLSFEPENPAMIIIGIGYKDFGSWIKKRARDYLPSHVNSAPGSGGADLFLTFLEAQLIPHINKTYRTNESRIIYGHSTAALFGIYTLFERPDLFEGYIITSPSVDEDNGYSMRTLISTSTSPTESVSVFFSHGTKEKQSFITAYKNFLTTLTNRKLSNIELKSLAFDASHMASMAPSFVKGLQYINGIN